MENKIISIAIVAGGKRDYLKSLLDSVLQQTYSDLEIIVIDNSPEQNLRGLFAKRYLRVKFYSRPNNPSYCSALNKAIDLSMGNFILCLNDDVVLGNGFIEEALKGFQANKTIGMVSGKIYRFDIETIDSTGLYLSTIRIAKERGYGIKDRGQFFREGFVFGVSGAVAFYSRQMLEEIKIDGEYFDSSLRFFYEDLDICWRAQNLGWKGYYIPTAIAYHLRGGTTRKDCGMNKGYARRYLSDELHFDLVKNRYLTVLKNERFPTILFSLPITLVSDIPAWLYIIFFRAGALKLFLRKRIPFWAALRKRKYFKLV